MDGGKEGLTEIDRMLAEALDVDVSAGFDARVRQRIANEPMRAPFWHGWRIGLAAAAAAVAIAAVGLSTFSTRGRPAPTTVLAARSLPLMQLRPADVRPNRVASGGGSVAAVNRSRTALIAPIASQEPEVLVPREEIEMYRRLIAAAQNAPHAVVIESPEDIVASRSIPEITIEPIKIELIMPPPVGGEGDRQ